MPSSKVIKPESRLMRVFSLEIRALSSLLAHDRCGSFLLDATRDRPSLIVVVRSSSAAMEVATSTYKVVFQSQVVTKTVCS